MSLNDQLPDWILEEYSVGVLPEAESAQVEEHLLVCSECQDRLTEVDAYVQTMRQALALRVEPASSWQPRWLIVCRWAAQPALAAVVLGLLIAVALVGVRQGPWSEDGGSVAVILKAPRGVDARHGTFSPAGRPLRLTLDVTGLPRFASYSVEMMDSAGARIVAAQVRPEHGALSFATPKLVPGSYWVRIYDPNQRLLLREFSLRCR